ncbi:MAG: class I SAM-dependent methyltransferase [Solirubrobacterales bacterium]|nr:class I SAM-dependent methyltransferase [Solirubrobacterales bacterium]
MLAAGGRKSHLLMHGPRAVLTDWLAWPFVGCEAEAPAASARTAFGERAAVLATCVSARSRITEDWLASSGAEQYVALSAGLDSFAWWQTEGVRVFEVDHPATQAWKRSRLEALGIATPPELVWVPVDFEVESITDGLSRAGLGADETFISWLGVTPYLSLDAIAVTLRGLPPSLLAVSYATPADTWPADARAVSSGFRTMADKAGEPAKSRFTPDEFTEVLADHQFALLEDVGFEYVAPRYGVPVLSVGNERIALASKGASHAQTARRK